MKLRDLAIMAMLLAGATVSRADIVTASLADDGDGVMTCYSYGLQQIGPQQFQLGIDGTHNVFAKGDILGSITTDTETDPSLTLLHGIDNDTALTWTDYHVKVTLNKSFTLSNPTVDHGWSSVITPVSLVGGSWVGYVDYYAGSPVAPLDTLNFGYTMTFIGSVSFAEELTPTVPEPGTFALVLGGLVGLVAFRRRSV